MPTNNEQSPRIEPTSLSGRPRESEDPALGGSHNQKKEPDSRLRGNDRRMWLALVAALLIFPGASVVRAEPYPNRPIRIVVPTQAGAAQDILARLMQPYLEKSLGQPVIVENRSGASTMIGTDAVAKAAPDGHTLLIVPTTFTVNAALNTKLAFDLEHDFEPITVLVKNPLLFATNAKVPAKSLKEFVALAKAEPGKFNYGTSGASTQAHLLLELWSTQAGIKMQHVPYRGGAPAALAVASGEVQLVLLSPLGILPQVQAGLVRPLATGGRERDPKMPDLPTAAEAGFPGFVAEQWLGLLTTAGTPKEIVARLNAEVNRILREPNIIAKLALQGTTAAGGTPDEFRALILDEVRNWKEIALKANIKPAE